MLIKQAPDIPSSEITPEEIYRTRRDFIRKASGATGAALVAGTFGDMLAMEQQAVGECLCQCYIFEHQKVRRKLILKIVAF